MIRIGQPQSLRIPIHICKGRSQGWGESGSVGWTERELRGVEVMRMSERKFGRNVPSRAASQVIKDAKTSSNDCLVSLGISQYVGDAETRSEIIAGCMIQRRAYGSG